MTVDVAGIHKIKHVVIIMQENRSFDSYFGTYPGADGIPPGVCVPDPMHRRVRGAVPRSRRSRTTEGRTAPRPRRPTSTGATMDGFVAEAEKGAGCSTDDPTCSPCQQDQAQAGQQRKCVDVMGYHDAREIPNYWKYAHDFVLQDHMFEPDASWSLPESLYKVSEWSASCTNPLDPLSCKNALENPIPGRRLHRTQRRATPLRVDGHDLPAAQGQCQLGLLRLQGNRAGLRE